MVSSKKQSFKFIIMMIILTVSSAMLISRIIGKDEASVPSETTTVSMGTTTDGTTYNEIETTGSQEQSSKSETAAESIVTTLETTGSDASASSVLETETQESRDTPETTASTSTTSGETTAETTTAVASYTEPDETFGPYDIEDISGYDIIDPGKDYSSEEDPGDYINLDSITRGIVRIHYPGTDAYKVRIEKGDSFYNYDLPGGDIMEVYPLQMGTGNYRTMILKKVADNRYTVICTKNFYFEITDENYIYINSVQNIHWLPEMQPIIFARNELIYDVLNGGSVPLELLDRESFRVLWSYIIRNISYDREKYSDLANMAGYIPDVETIYIEKKGICYDYSSFMASLLRSFGLPVKLVTGYCTAYYGDSYHAWNEVFIEGVWITVDATYDAAYYQAGYEVEYIKDSDLYSVSKIY